MAFYDDRDFLVSRVHHLFLMSDEGGTCEAVFHPSLGVVDPQSLDLGAAVGVGHRRRSNTTEKLEKLKRDRMMRAKIQMVRWRTCTLELTEKDLWKIFPKKDLSIAKKEPSVKSALSVALEQLPNTPSNPFGDYARFDGRFNRSAASKRIRIFPAVQKEERNYAIEVVCLSSAKVHELIGLFCWMYTNEIKEPKLKNSVSDYSLKIAEETGEVDEDFPSLDANELVGKYGFTHLALFERTTKQSAVFVTMYIDDNPIKFDVPTLNLSVREAVELASQRVPVENSNAYHIEKMDEPGVAVPLNSKLFNFASLIFRVIFEGDSKERNPELLAIEYDSYLKVVKAPLYRSFTVTLTPKIGINYDAQLGISGEKVEIDPMPPKGVARLLSRQQKASTLLMDRIASCEIVSKKYYTGRCTFRIVYQNGQEFKKYVFLTDSLNGQDIVQKIQMILQMYCTSNACKEYQAYKERKRQKKLRGFRGSFSKRES